jgi:Flp pilus assembly protein TadD
MTWNVSPSREEIAFLMEASLIYRDSGRFTEAREVLAGVRALLPANETAAVLLGTVILQQGDFEGAARQYRQALDFNPHSAYAYAHLGELEILRMNKEQAATYLKEAVKLDPRGVYGTFARSLLEFGTAVQYKDKETV